MCGHKFALLCVSVIIGLENNENQHFLFASGVIGMFSIELVPRLCFQHVLLMLHRVHAYNAK